MTDSNGHSLAVAKYWDKRGDTYGRSWQSLAKKRLSGMETGLVRQTVKSVCTKDPEKPVKILDIGIGLGRIADAVIKYNTAIYGTDISRTMIEYSQKKYRRNKNIRKLIVHDILKPLPAGWNNFDIITAFRVLSYYRELSRELINIRKSLKSGGILIFTYPNKYSSVILPKILNKGNWLGHELSLNELCRIIRQAGFSDCRVGGFARILDTVYDRCNSRISVGTLFTAEKLLSYIFGPTLFVRLFYITCRK